MKEGWTLGSLDPSTALGPFGALDFLGGINRSQSGPFCTDSDSLHDLRSWNNTTRRQNVLDSAVCTKTSFSLQ